MNFTELPLKTKKRIYTSAVIFFFVAYFSLSLLTKKLPGFGVLKFLMLIGLIVTAKKLGVIQNIEKGLPEDYISPENKRIRNIVLLLVSVGLTTGALLFYYIKY